MPLSSCVAIVGVVQSRPCIRKISLGHQYFRARGLCNVLGRLEFEIFNRTERYTTKAFCNHSQCADQYAEDSTIYEELIHDVVKPRTVIVAARCLTSTTTETQTNARTKSASLDRCKQKKNGVFKRHSSGVALILGALLR